LQCDGWDETLGIILLQLNYFPPSFSKAFGIRFSREAKEREDAVVGAFTPVVGAFTPVVGAFTPVSLFVYVVITPVYQFFGALPELRVT